MQELLGTLQRSRHPCVQCTPSPTTSTTASLSPDQSLKGTLRRPQLRPMPFCNSQPATCRYVLLRLLLCLACCLEHGNCSAAAIVTAVYSICATFAISNFFVARDSTGCNCLQVLGVGRQFGNHQMLLLGSSWKRCSRCWSQTLARPFRTVSSGLA